ncbi:MAG TPA: ComF family protein [Candidatus Deferrimicrobium sp.]|nr:ComF family protein [Candidatus Deferrimicrobium sp.]
MRLLSMFYELWTKGLDLVYPGSSKCPLCGSPGKCTCRVEIIRNFRTSNTCSRCGKFLASGAICYDCYRRGRGFPEQVYALAPYSGGIRRAIHTFKYQGDQHVGHFLAELLWEGPGRELSKPDLIIPVPLYEDKYQQRGFNQAELLANYLGDRLFAKLDPRALVRTVSTQPQSELSRHERRENLMNAFQCPHPERIKDKNILLVDDIVTTGSTLEGCGIALRAAGARSLKGICLAAGSQFK